MSKIELDIEETKKYVEYGVLVYIENGKKTYYKLRTLTIEESKHISTSEHELTHTLIPLTSAELKEIGIEESAAQELQGQEVDIEESQAEAVAEEKKSNLTLSGDKDAVRAARKILEASSIAKPITNEKEAELQEENEDLKNKLGIIAEKKLDEKRNAVTGKINALIADPQKRAEMIEKLKSQSPEGISNMDSMMNLLEDQLSKSKNERYEPAGSAPMNPQQMGSSIETDDIYRKKFGSYSAMITALREESKSEDKQKAQRANLVLNQLLNKYAVAQRDVHTEQRFCEDDAIPKTDKVPTVDFSKSEEPFSELERFGIKKNPLNYSRNRHKIIAQRGQGE